MSIILQNALKSYQAGKYRHSLSLLTPLLAKADAGLQTVLLAAQCHAKAEQYSDAAKLYGRASELDGGKQAMFKTLAAAMLMRANEIEAGVDRRPACGTLRRFQYRLRGNLSALPAQLSLSRRGRDRGPAVPAEAEIRGSGLFCS
ncbi:hypothetical protein P6U16_20440 [Rhizobium sp. 32-5/1]|uniref:hypothetical protein n=1 Tax=Rhizobium sp. 32-5/1 TaxID=3019602 RepID=UPI00240CEFDB|nr:hypothetical protein [Rhizobium sp. 32-5/1]WEZ83199.1 hypothetical protein P6U16_20440 [Rhizobium sp. 32-5/1]